MSRSGHLPDLEEAVLRLLDQNTDSSEEEAVQRVCLALLARPEDVIALPLFSEVNLRLISGEDRDPSKVVEEFKSVLEEEVKAFLNKRSSSSHGFSYFNFDDLPEYEPLEVSLVLLRADPEDLFALNKVRAMDPEDLLEHQQWEELLALLRVSLNSRNHKAGDLSLDIHESFMVRFNGFQVVGVLTSLLCHLSQTFLHPEIESPSVPMQGAIDRISEDEFTFRRLRTVGLLVSNLVRLFHTIPDKFTEQLIFSLFILLGQGIVFIKQDLPCSLLVALGAHFPSQMLLRHPLQRWSTSSCLSHAVASGLLSSLQNLVYNLCPSGEVSLWSPGAAQAWLLVCETYLLLLPAHLLRPHLSARVFRRISFHHELPPTDHLTENVLSPMSEQSFTHSSHQTKTQSDAQSTIFALFVHIYSTLTALPPLNPESYDIEVQIIVMIFQMSWDLLSCEQYAEVVRRLLNISLNLSKSKPCNINSSLSHEFRRICKLGMVEKGRLSVAIEAWVGVVLFDGGSMDALEALFSTRLKHSNEVITVVKPYVVSYIQSILACDEGIEEVSIEPLSRMLESAECMQQTLSPVFKSLSVALIKRSLFTDTVSNQKAVLRSLLMLALSSEMPPIDKLEVFHVEHPSCCMVRYLASLASIGRHLEAFKLVSKFSGNSALNIHTHLNAIINGACGEWEEALQVISTVSLMFLNSRVEVQLLHPGNFANMLSWPLLPPLLRSCLSRALRGINSVGCLLVCEDDYVASDQIKIEQLSIHSKISWESLRDIIVHAEKNVQLSFSNPQSCTTGPKDDIIVSKIRLVHACALTNSIITSSTDVEDFVKNFFSVLQLVGLKYINNGATWWIAVCLLFVNPSTVYENITRLLKMYNLTMDGLSHFIEEESWKALMNSPSRQKTSNIILAKGLPTRYISRLVLEQWFFEFVPMRQVVLVSILTLFGGPQSAIDLLGLVIEDVSLWLLHQEDMQLETSGDGSGPFWLLDYMLREEPDGLVDRCPRL